jgi:hypothetical protein
MAPDRPIYTVRFRPEPGVDGIRNLRHLLKRALRDWGLRCVDISEGAATITVSTDG